MLQKRELPFLVPVVTDERGEEAMSEQNRGERLQIMLTEDELAVLDDWRFANRMPSRAAAVRELLKRGLADLLERGPEGRTRSADFGVTAPDAAAGE